jgi:hypothetical protein
MKTEIVEFFFLNIEILWKFWIFWEIFKFYENWIFWNFLEILNFFEIWKFWTLIYFFEILEFFLEILEILKFYENWIFLNFLEILKVWTLNLFFGNFRILKLFENFEILWNFWILINCRAIHKSQPAKIQNTTWWALNKSNDHKIIN